MSPFCRPTSDLRVSKLYLAPFFPRISNLQSPKASRASKAHIFSESAKNIEKSTAQCMSQGCMKCTHKVVTSWLHNITHKLIITEVFSVSTPQCLLYAAGTSSIASTASSACPRPWAYWLAVSSSRRPPCSGRSSGWPSCACPTRC